MLCMADKTNHLFACEKALIASAVRVHILLNVWHATHPDDAFGTREHVLEELVLAAEVHIDVASAKTWRLAGLDEMTELANSSDSLLVVDKLNVAIHGLGGRALHDNMDWTATVRRDHLGIAADEMDNFLLGDRVRDLG